MDTIIFIIFGVISLYITLVLLLRKAKQSDLPEKHGWLNNVDLYGPLIALKSTRTGIFDRFIRYSGFFKKYGSLGIVLVASVAAFMVLALVMSLSYTIVTQPEPTGIYEPQNILLIPGVNNFIPSTIAVWLGLLVAIGIHELGHAILCRVEGIRVESFGVIFFVIPIGFFVEPKESDVEKVPMNSKNRMFGAGITNNIVVGLVCFILFVALLGTVIPQNGVFVYGVYENYPAYTAGIQPNDQILSIDGILVNNYTDVAWILNNKKAGDTVNVKISRNFPITEDMKKNHVVAYKWETSGDVILSEIEGRAFMGINYYPSQDVVASFKSFYSVQGFFYFLSLPVSKYTNNQNLQMMMPMVLMDSPESSYFITPFENFWSVVHIIFWCGWININLALFNAIPMLPLDGGLIMRNYVGETFNRKNWSKYTKPVTVAISAVIFAALVMLIAVPYLTHAGV